MMLPSALIGENIPPFKLPNLYNDQKIFSPESLPKQVALINVWATWCYACSLEHDMLMKIANDYHILFTVLITKMIQKKQRLG